MASSLVVILLASSLWAQHRYSSKAEDAAIKRVKNIDVSSLEQGLPKVPLEFFLKYEGEGVPIKWRMNICDRLTGSRSIDREQDSTICVEAAMDLKSDRSATIIVSVGTRKTGPVGVPTLFSVTVTDPGGLVHDIRHLGDLPVELRRPLPKSPRDLLPPVGTMTLPLAAGRHPSNELS